MAELLGTAEVEAALGTLDGWSGDSSAIARSVTAPSFAAGITLVDVVAKTCDEMDHHADIDIRWTTIRFVLSTHSVGGVTRQDVELARRIDEVAKALGGGG